MTDPISPEFLLVPRPSHKHEWVKEDTKPPQKMVACRMAVKKPFGASKKRGESPTQNLPPSGASKSCPGRSRLSKSRVFFSPNLPIPPHFWQNLFVILEFGFVIAKFVKQIVAIQKSNLLDQKNNLKFSPSINEPFPKIPPHLLPLF